MNCVGEPSDARLLAKRQSRHQCRERGQRVAAIRKATGSTEYGFWILLRRQGYDPAGIDVCAGESVVRQTEWSGGSLAALRAIAAVDPLQRGLRWLLIGDEGVSGEVTTGGLP